MSDADLRALLTTPDPKARDDLRRVLIRDQADRDAIFLPPEGYRDRASRLGGHHRLPDDVAGWAAEGIGISHAQMSRATRQVAHRRHRSAA
jgi:hypothetical protein